MRWQLSRREWTARPQRKYLRGRRLPSELPAAARWRTRTDPFEDDLGRTAGAVAGQPWVGSQDVVRLFYSGSIPAAFRMDTCARYSDG